MKSILIYTATFYPDINGVSIRYQILIEGLLKYTNFKIHLVTVINKNLDINNLLDNSDLFYCKKYFNERLFIYDIGYNIILFKNTEYNLRTNLPLFVRKKKIFNQIDNIIIKNNIKSILIVICDNLCIKLVKRYKNLNLILSHHTQSNVKPFKFNYLNMASEIYIKQNLNKLLKFKNSFRLIAPTHESIKNIKFNNINYKIIPKFVNIDNFKIDKINKDEEELILSNWKNNTIRIVNHSRISQEKKQIELIELAKKTENLSVVIIGDGPYRNYLENKINEHNLNDRVKITGFKSHQEIAKYINFADIYINPSDFETLGFTTIEAMACKALVIAKNEGGTKELIEHNKNGLLYNKFDELNKIIINYIKNLDNKEYLKNINNIKNNALLYTKNFDERNYINFFEDLFK